MHQVHSLRIAQQHDQVPLPPLRHTLALTLTLALALFKPLLWPVLS